MIDPRHIEAALVDEWLGCYKSGWKGLICDESFAHPAKFARNLIERIYAHVIAEGWVSAGDRVVDPFGGVALVGFDAMRHGLHWTGCELEAKFHGLGNQNILLWNERFSRMPQWGTARLLNGDSRKLASVLSEAHIAMSSPPYEGIRQDGGRIALEGAGGFGAYTDEPADHWHTQRDQNNLGNLKTGETFWSASRIILEQLHSVLTPDAHAVFVVKAFVRNKQIVDFPAQWAQLCEAVGFRLLHDHHAMLTEEYGEQHRLDGGSDTKTVARKSFFRRLAESKGSPKIDYENILCFERPL